MNTSLTVKLSADTNDIPIMYRVVEMTPASSAGGTYCVLQVVRVGWDTFANYNNWKATSTYDTVTERMYLTGRNPTGMQGTLGALSVQALTAIESYAPQTPSMDQ
jgi:hypothetical protein